MNQVKKPESGKDAVLAWCVLERAEGQNVASRIFAKF